MNTVQVKIKKDTEEVTPQKTSQPVSLSIPAKNRKIWKKICWLIFLFFLIETVYLGFTFWKKSASLEKLLPQNAALTVSLNQTEVKSLISNLQAKNYLWPALGEAAKNINQFLKENNLDLARAPEIFGNQITLSLLANAPDSFEWLTLTTIRISPGELERDLTSVQKNLKNNFNIVSESYRQTEIVQIKNLINSSRNIFYSQIKNYFLAGSSQEIIEKTIDQVLKLK